MNASLLPRKSRAGTGAWVLEDVEDSFDDFVTLPAYKAFRSYGLHMDAHNVIQTKWDLRTKARPRPGVFTKNNAIISDERRFSKVSLNETPHETTVRDNIYPPMLIRWFAAGACTFLLGVLLVPVMLLFGGGPVDFIAPTLMSTGAFLIAITISNGQEIDESGA